MSNQYTKLKREMDHLAGAAVRERWQRESLENQLARLKATYENTGEAMIRLNQNLDDALNTLKLICRDSDSMVARHWAGMCLERIKSR